MSEGKKDGEEAGETTAAKETDETCFFFQKRGNPKTQ